MMHAPGDNAREGERATTEALQYFTLNNTPPVPSDS